MKYEIETVLAGARAQRIEGVEATRDLLRGLLEESNAYHEGGVAARQRLAAAMRNMAIQVDEGLPPFDGLMLQEATLVVNRRVKEALEGTASKAERYRLDRRIKEARARLATMEQCPESALENYLRAAMAAGETHVSTNALKDAGATPREIMELVARGQHERFGSNA